MQMWIYVVRRLFLLIPIIIGVMTITFVLTSALPVQQRFIAAHGTPPVRSPWQYNQYLQPGQGACPPAPNTKACPNPLYNQLLNQLGLNKPIPEQWAIYIYHSLTFQWGVVGNDSTASTTITIIKGQPVTTVLSWFLPYTVELALLSLAIILMIAIPFGNLAAVNRNRPIDQGARVISFSGFAVAPFLLSSLVLIAIVVLLGASSGYHTSSPWCPGSGEGTFFEFYGSWPQSTCFANAQYPSWLVDGVVSHPTGFPTVDAAIHHQYWLALDSLIRIILPALVIAFGSIAVLLRFVRNSMLEVMNLDFVRTARAEGIPERTVVKRHAGRNSLNVTITVLGLTFAFFIGGFPVIEDVFHLNGVGLMLALAVQQSVAPIDFGLVFGSTLLFTYIVVIANIIVDVLYAYLDPRVRLG
jgi:ABC-type dipeptide/oligopeptide/nickel transport system permease component